MEHTVRRLTRDENSVRQSQEFTFPPAFVEAVTEKTVACISPESDTSQDSSEDNLVILSNDRRPSLIPETVLEALNTIQRSQLRRIRDDISLYLEDILRSVVDTVDKYYYHERERVSPTKKMIGEDYSEEEKERRIKNEIRKIIKGVRLSKRESEENIVEVEVEGEEEKDETGTHFVQQQTPICQVMLDLVDKLFGISHERHTLLNEVLQWTEGYPADHMDTFISENTFGDIESEMFENWEVHKNIRRLTLISQEMGLPVPGEVHKRNRGDQRQLLEDKMEKQRIKYVVTKVHDMESLVDPKNWHMASRNISQVMEETASTTTNNKTKLLFNNSLKQFNYMTMLSEKRNEERVKLITQVDNVNGKLAKERNEVKNLRKKKAKMESMVEKQEEEMVELRRELEIKNGVIGERDARIYELEILQDETPEPKIIYQQVPAEAVAIENVASQPLPPAPQPTQPVQPASEPVKEPAKQAKPVKAVKQQKRQSQAQVKQRRESVVEKNKEKEDAVRISVINSLKEAKRELEEIRKNGEARENKLKELKLKLKTEAENFEQEKFKLNEEIEFHRSQTLNAKKQLELELELWEQAKAEITHEKEKLSNEVQAKVEIINYQEQRIQEVAREMTLSLMRAGLKSTSTGRENATDKLLESKQMLAKLHLQYEYEMEKLRSFVERESERHNAELRKLEQDHKKDLHIICRDTSVIFRAVNRFKECLASLLERENQSDVAYGVRHIPNLVEDDTTTDPHIRLARMAGSVTELMVQMEFKMSQALMNKRMELKETSLAKNFVNKDLEVREELLRKARELGNLQAEKLKSVREELSSQELEYLKLKQAEEEKLTDISERNRELSKQNQTLNREITILQKGIQEDNVKHENQINDMKKANRELQKNLEEQEMEIIGLRSENTRILNEQKLTIKKTDLLRNIKLINDAYSAKKISREKQQLAITTVEQTIEVSAMPFVHMVRRYVLYRTWKKVCETLAEFRKGMKRHPRVEKYLKTVEKNIEKRKIKLQEAREEFLERRTDMYMLLKNICNDFTKEDGVILIKPRMRKDLLRPETRELDWLVQSRRSLRILRTPHKPVKQKRTQVEPQEVGEIQGIKYVSPEISEQKSWQLPNIQTSQSAVITPQILALDINEARQYSSERVLTSKSCGYFGKDENPGTLLWHQKRKQRDALFTLPPIASLYPENY